MGMGVYPAGLLEDSRWRALPAGYWRGYRSSTIHRRMLGGILRYPSTAVPSCYGSAILLCAGYISSGRAVVMTGLAGEWVRITAGIYR